MENSNKKVSVCMATYNGEKFIKTQLESILFQINDNDEIIISDNGSTDRTLEIVRNFGDKRIKIYNCPPYYTGKISYEKKLRNIYFNFKNAFNKSTGDYIFLSDQDDIWEKFKYTEVLKILDHNNMVIHNCKIFSNDINNNKDFFEVINFNKLSFFKILKDNPFLGCCMSFKKNIGEVAFSGNRAVIPHDTWLALVAYVLNSNKICITNKSLLKYRVHSMNNSYITKSNNSLFFKIKYRIQIIINLMICMKKNRD